VVLTSFLIEPYIAFSGVETGTAATAASAPVVVDAAIPAAFELNNLLIDPYTRRSTSLSGVASV
jgi:hypothetical protein